MNNDKIKRILFTGSNGFPFGSAVTQRQMQLAKALVERKYKVTVLNSRGAHSKSIIKRENISTFGTQNGINYVYSSVIPYRSNIFIFRNIFKLIGFFGEFCLILYYRFFKNVKYLFNNSINLKHLKYYYFLAKILKIELIYDYVEMVSSIGNRGVNDHNIANNSFDSQFFKYIDKLIIISNFLDCHVHKFAPHVAKIKIPPIIDFSYFDKVKPKIEVAPFFLFCGSSAYMDIIIFIIESYQKSKAIDNMCHLKLVINGKSKEIDFLKKLIEEKKTQNEIQILSNLAYSELVSFYKAARALLIPLKDNLQDQARFPFKICEYVASQRPIITSNTLLINEYFVDNSTALIANIDDSDDFGDKLNILSKNPSLANNIGQNAYKMGMGIFNFKAYSKEIDIFLHN